MGIRDNGGGNISGGSGGGSGAGKNGVIWGGFIVEGDGSVNSVVASVVVQTVGFYFSAPVFVSVNVFALARRQLQTHFSQR